jgi:hypothetical protein
MALVFLAGCEMNVKEVTSRLRIGMTKMEMDQCLKGQKFLKEQVALIYPNSTEESLERLLRNSRSQRRRSSDV